MTEKEAKTKKCPIFGIVIAITASVDALRKDLPKQAIIDSGLCCIASDCMMWRSIRKEVGTKWNYDEDGTEHEEPMYEDIGGYCGLASKP